MSLVLAADLGGSGLRAATIAPDGTVGALCRTELRVSSDSSGRSEADPEDWWRCLVATVERMADEGADLGAVDGIAICGMTRTQVFLDDAGRVVRPAITFRDSRSTPAIDEKYRQTDLSTHPAARHFNAYHPLARLVWLKDCEPMAWKATRVVVEPKDYLNFRLTGELSSDPISQHWMGESFAEFDGAGRLASHLGIDRDVRPAVVAPIAEMGRVHDTLEGALSNLAHVPVFSCSTDTWAAAVGIGALKHARGYNFSGTTEVLGLIADRRGDCEGLIPMKWGADLWHLGGPSQNGATLLEWAIARLAPDSTPETILDRADVLRFKPLIFLPYLDGERTPFWDRDLRASFIGLGSEHSAEDMVWAVAEGLCFLNRLVLEKAERAFGIKASEIRFGGGGSKSPGWAQLKSSILNRPVSVNKASEMGLLGCAAVTNAGLGNFASLDDAMDAVTSDSTPFAPDRRLTDALGERYRIFRRAHEAVRDISHDLMRHRRTTWSRCHTRNC